MPPPCRQPGAGRFRSWNVRASQDLAWNYGGDLIDTSARISGRVSASDPDYQYSRVGNFRLGRDAGDLFELRPDNIFLVKLSYWLNP
jgi:hypothetical protein